MTFEDYFKNEKLYKSLADEINTNAKMLSSFQSAIEQISSVSKYRGLLGITNDSLSSAGASLYAFSDTQSGISKLLQANSIQAAVVGSAFQDNFKFNGAANLLRTAYEPVFEQQRMLEDAQSSVRAIIEAESTFADRLKTNVYIKKSPVDDAVSGVGAALAEVNKSYGKSMLPAAMAGLSTLQTALSGIDKNYDGARLAVEQVATAGHRISELLSPSWLREDSPWKTAIDKLTNLGIDQVKADTPLMRLINAESETGRLLGKMGIDTSVTSAAAQMASIFQTEGLQNIVGITSLLSSYSDFALSQHKQIQKALGDGRDRDAEWRIGLLDTTAKFVDRQITWDNDVAEDIQSSIIETEEADYEPIKKDEIIENSQTETNEPISVFTILPRDLGYSNREGSDITVEFAFGKSKFLEITEIGKGITDSILAINRYRQDQGLENVFRYTNKNVGFMLDIGKNVCESEHTFGDMIDHLYFLFYENLEHIKELIGKGNKKQGDSKVRNEDIYQCIFRVKDIRSDLRHDLEHGSESEIQKKRERTALAYKHYSAKRPRTPKEYKTFQIKIYREFAELLVHICEEVEQDDD